MDVNDLLVRTLNASREAEKKGCYETADAFDDILDNLLDFLYSRSHLERETPVIVLPELQHLH